MLLLIFFSPIFLSEYEYPKQRRRETDFVPQLNVRLDLALSY